MSSPENRRQQERISARIEVRFTDKTQAARAFRAYSLNFSTGGLCLRTRRSYSVGTVLSISLEVEGECFTLKAEVAWARGEAIGVRFLNVTDEVRERLEAVALSLKNKPPQPPADYLRED